MSRTITNKLVTKSAMTHKPGKYWPIVKWALILLAAFLILYLGTLPVRGKLAKKYISQGDSYLAQGKFISAELAYRKANMLSPRNVIAKERQELTHQSAQNVLAMEDFIKKSEFQSKIGLFRKATAVPKSETEAVRISKELIDAGEYQLAIIPAQNATEMDKTYRDAWLYLGIANIKASLLVELKNEIRTKYQNAAKEALQKAHDLDPTYQPTLDYLKGLE